jgi:hypothetical protein
MNSLRMKAFDDMPFDGKRMVHGGFETQRESKTTAVNLFNYHHY